MTAQFVLFTITIYGFLLLGYGARSLLPPVAKWSRPLTRVFLIYITPLITLNSFWSIDLRNAQLLTLPLVSAGLQDAAAPHVGGVLGEDGLRESGQAEELPVAQGALSDELEDQEPGGVAEGGAGLGFQPSEGLPFRVPNLYLGHKV